MNESFLRIDKPFLQGHLLSFRGRTLNLSAHPVTARVFRIFGEAPQRCISKEEIVARLYPCVRRDISIRLRRSLCHNTIKMISRARNIATEAFREYGVHEIDWFPYDARNKTWRMMRVAPSYLESHLRIYLGAGNSRLLSQVEALRLLEN